MTSASTGRRGSVSEDKEFAAKCKRVLNPDRFRGGDFKLVESFNDFPIERLFAQAQIDARALEYKQLLKSVRIYHVDTEEMKFVPEKKSQTTFTRLLSAELAKVEFPLSGQDVQNHAEKWVSHIVRMSKKYLLDDLGYLRAEKMMRFGWNGNLEIFDAEVLRRIMASFINTFVQRILVNVGEKFLNAVQPDKQKILDHFIRKATNIKISELKMVPLSNYKDIAENILVECASFESVVEGKDDLRNISIFCNELKKTPKKWVNDDLIGMLAVMQTNIKTPQLIVTLSKHMHIALVEMNKKTKNHRSEFTPASHESVLEAREAKVRAKEAEEVRLVVDELVDAVEKSVTLKNGRM